MSEFSEWLKSLPKPQQRSIILHLRWLNGRMPSEVYKESRVDFTDAPIAKPDYIPWKNKRSPQK